MFVIANLLISLARVADILLTIYMYMIIGRAIISWVNPDPYNPIVNFLNRATEPVLARIRSKIPYMGGFDLSPMIVILAIFFLQNFLIRTVSDIGYRLKMGGML
jgi:YggT family protein